MHKNWLAAGVAAAALIPSLAFAQQTCDQRRNNQVAGTVAGAALGAVIGSQVSGNGARTEGSVIGAIGGALLGNQIAKGSSSQADCARAYGYYDNDGHWHATGVSRTAAAGYYDRNGVWVDGAPNGYYTSDGRWVQATSSVQASGYYDANGRWVPASASGYYDANGQWNTAQASGYYDSRGRWIAGPASGRYDSNGRWIAGEPAGHRDANGRWVSAAQAGYYDTNGRWRAGPAMGYYDTQGRWIATAPYAGAMAADASYETRGYWNDAPADIRGRQAWLEQRVRDGLRDGTLSRAEADRALRDLSAIRRQERGMRHYRNGRLGPRDQATIQARLDNVSANLRWDRRDDRRNGRRTY